MQRSLFCYIMPFINCFYLIQVVFILWRHAMIAKMKSVHLRQLPNNENIIRQLPKFLQCQYPGYMTHRSEVSKTVGDLL